MNKLSLYVNITLGPLSFQTISKQPHKSVIVSNDIETIPQIRYRFKRYRNNPTNPLSFQTISKFIILEAYYNMNENTAKWDISIGQDHILGSNDCSLKELLGGFGPGQRILTIPQIAKIHADNPNNQKEVSDRIRRLNELINNNLFLSTGESYFDFGIYILDLKASSKNKHLIKSLIEAGVYTQNSVNRAKNIYILSEQGYSLLTNLMNDPKVKLIYKQVIRNYFKLKTFLLTADDLEQYFNRVEGKIARKMMTDIVKHFADMGEFNSYSYNPYAVETNFIYNMLFGMTARQIEQHLNLNLKSNDTIRNYIDKDDLRLLKEAEERFKFLFELGFDYQKIKSTMLSIYKAPRQIKPSVKTFKMIESNINP